MTTAIPGRNPSSIEAPSVPVVFALTTAVTIARPIAPPTWNDVLTSPDASPCSWSATPAVAWMLSDGKQSANPSPIRIMLGRNTVAYESDSPIRRNSA